MSAARPERTDRWRWLPDRLAPLGRERPGRGDLRRVETAILALIGVLLAVATVNDLVRKIDVNHRLAADMRTWRTVTAHDYRNLAIEQNRYGVGTREVVCGNTTPGPPEARVRLCLIITGPVRHGVRAVHGGYYLPPRVPDVAASRYGCFGTAVLAGLCNRRGREGS